MLIRFGVWLETHCYQFSLDLRSVFNWNVKQIFVFVVAEYRSTSNVSIASFHQQRFFYLFLPYVLQVLNQVVIWDAIVRTKKDAYLKFTDRNVEYFLADQYDELRYFLRFLGVTM